MGVMTSVMHALVHPGVTTVRGTLGGMMGYRGNPEWRDMSDFVVHFTKDYDGRSAYQNSLSILYAGVIRATNEYGQGRHLSALGSSQQCVCFSEIPLDLLDRLVDRRSRYGIGFTKEFVAAQGGAPVWYLEVDSPIADAFRDVKRQRMRGGIDPDDPIWRLTPFVDMPGDYGTAVYRFEWEREWRVAGDLRFAPENVAFLFIPEDLHPAARSFFADAERNHSGPAYYCPFLDPTWGDEEIQEALPAGDFAREEDPENPDDCMYRFVVTGMCAACGHAHGEQCPMCGGFHGPP
jgi:hypothetical protein